MSKTRDKGEEPVEYERIKNVEYRNIFLSRDKAKIKKARNIGFIES